MEKELKAPEITGVKPVIKSRKHFRKHIHPVDVINKILITFMAGIALFGAVNFFHVGSTELPDNTQVQQNVEKLNLDTTILSKYGDNTLSRYYESKFSDTIKVNLTGDFTPEEEQVIQECLDVYNNVFKVINPNYKFEIDKDVNALDRLAPNRITLGTVDRVDPRNPDAVGVEFGFGAPTKDGMSNIYNTIKFGSDSRENLGIFRSTVLHELMHVLGADDAYNKADYHEQTIMNATTTYSKTNDIYKHDVKMLAALYADLSDEETYNKIMEFIEHYGENSTYTDTSGYKFVD